MAIAKKGTKKIVVDDVDYSYKISRSKIKNGWREDKKELDETFLKYAQYYNLGQVSDITINITVQLQENPLSNLYIKIHTIIVDGFMGYEQVTQITPQQVAQFIKGSLKDGWKPSSKGDHRVSFVEKNSEKKPILLQLPDVNDDDIEYENIIKACFLQLQDSD